MTLDRFDRLVIGIIAALALALGGVAWIGARAGVPVSDTTPGDGDLAAVTTGIRIGFGQPVDRASVEAAFSLTPAVPGLFDWADDRTVVFTPVQPFAPGISITVALGEGARSTSGRAIRPRTWTFETRPLAIAYLAPADAARRALWIIPAEGGAPRELFSPAGGIYDFSPAHDGARIAVTVFDDQGTTDIWLVDRDGGGARLLIDCAPGLCAAPAWSPDGDLLAYERQSPTPSGGLGPSRIWLYDLRTGETAPVFEDSQVLGFGPRWSPDGSRLAFYDPSIGAIRVLDVVTGGEFRLPNQMGEVGSFSPDGRAMVYPEIRVVGEQFFPWLMLARLEVDGGIEPLLEQGEEDQWPSWSPDGRWIAFGRRRLDRQGGFTGQLMLLDRETGALRQVTADPDLNHTRFMWDPTSRRLAFQRFDVTQGAIRPEIWLYDLETGGMARLIENGDMAQWLP